MHPYIAIVNPCKRFMCKMAFDKIQTKKLRQCFELCRNQPYFKSFKKIKIKMEVIKICALQYNWIKQVKIGGGCK